MMEERLLVAVSFLLLALFAYVHGHPLLACLCGSVTLGMGDSMIREWRGK